MRKAVMTLNKLPKFLKRSIDEDDCSLATNMMVNDLGVIEVTNCVDKKAMKVEGEAVQILLHRAKSYSEYIPRCGGVRIIGVAFEPEVDLYCHAASEHLSGFSISIYRNCDRWVDISGIPIVNRPLRNIDDLINELVADMDRYLYLR